MNPLHSIKVIEKCIYSLIEDALEFLGKNQKYKDWSQSSAKLTLFWKANEFASFQGITHLIFICF